jgi:hypothetical protein
MTRRVLGALAVVAICTTALAVSKVWSAPKLDHYRQRLLFDFAASTNFIVFPAVLAPDTSGLIVVDRTSGEQKIIYDDTVVMRSPFLSADGERLLFVKRKTPQFEKELVSCNIAKWRCRTVLKTTATIFSPIELAPNTFLYSSSPIRKVNDRTRADHHDLFLLRDDERPIRLTNFGAYQLGRISVGGHRLLFSAVGHLDDMDTLRPPDPLAASSSDIFSVDFTDDYRVDLSERPVRRVFAMKGYSTIPSITADGQNIAFLNRRNKAGQTHFNLAVVDATGKIIRYIETQQFGFSRPMFVEGSIIANELHERRYDVTEYQLLDGKARILFRVDSSVESLKRLPRILLSPDN